jgi:hypothetical protein
MAGLVCWLCCVLMQDEVYCWGEADLPAAAGPANPAAASGNSEGGVSSEGGTSEPWRLGRQTSSVGNRQVLCTMLLWPLLSWGGGAAIVLPRQLCQELH